MTSSLAVRTISVAAERATAERYPQGSRQRTVASVWVDWLARVLDCKGQTNFAALELEWAAMGSCFELPPHNQFPAFSPEWWTALGHPYRDTDVIIP